MQKKRHAFHHAVYELFTPISKVSVYKHQKKL
jgi:hypothetical protein